MGVNDIQTAEYVSKMLGVSTVESNTIRKDAGFDGKIDLGKEGITTIKRNLMNPDEIMQMSNDLQIVLLRGQKPFLCKKFDYSEYKLANQIEEIEIEKYRKKIEIEEKNVLEDEKLPTFQEFLQSKKGGKKC